VHSRLGILAGILILLGCGGGGDDGAAPTESTPAPPPAPAAAPDAAEQAGFIFETRCFTCHGAEGKGDGPGSAALAPPPRNFQDGEWQASVTDEHLGQIILYGGIAVGKSAAMPGNPDLTSKPEVLTALVAYVRGLKSP